MRLCEGIVSKIKGELRPGASNLKLPRIIFLRSNKSEHALELRRYNCDSEKRSFYRRRAPLRFYTAKTHRRHWLHYRNAFGSAKSVIIFQAALACRSGISSRRHVNDNCVDRWEQMTVALASRKCSLSTPTQYCPPPHHSARVMEITR